MTDRPARSLLKMAMAGATSAGDVITVLILAAPGANAWFSSDDNRNLPFGCEGFGRRR